MTPDEVNQACAAAIAATWHTRIDLSEIGEAGRSARDLMTTFDAISKEWDVDIDLLVVTVMVFWRGYAEALAPPARWRRARSVRLAAHTRNIYGGGT